MDSLTISAESGIPDEIEVGARYIGEQGYTMTVVAVDVEKRVARCRDDNGCTFPAAFADFIPGESGYNHPRWMLLPAEDLTALMLAPGELTPEGASDSTALGFRTSKGAVEAAKRHMAQVSQRAEIVKRLIEQKLAEVRGVARLTSARLDYMNQVLKAMESYLGLYQELLTIREGEPAPFDTPIHFMQSILWMDEEVGDVELRGGGGGRGIDFQSIDLFDKWIATGDNVRNIAPFPKCVVALQPSRQIRDYGDPLLNAANRSGNEIVYLLIRNGDRLTRVCTTLIGGEVLFPTQDIWDKIAAAQAKAEQVENEVGRLKAKSAEFAWLERIVLLQGLLERTTVLDPKPAGLNIFDPAVYDAGHVVLFRDFEQAKLPTGRPTFQEWRKANLETIEVGSRIIYAGGVSVIKKYSLWRFGYRYSHLGNAPFPPSPGVYTVEEVKREDRYGWLRYRILYRPERYWGEDSQRRVSFWLENDDLILAYDQVSLEDVAYYIGLRIERRGYQKTLPMLYTIYRERVAEHTWETEFVRSMAARLNVAEADVWAAVEWWKMKVKSKRPITQDEAKAWRMIERKVKGDES